MPGVEEEKLCPEERRGTGWPRDPRDEKHALHGQSPARGATREARGRCLQHAGTRAIHGLTPPPWTMSVIAGPWQRSSSSNAASRARTINTNTTALHRRVLDMM